MTQYIATAPRHVLTIPAALSIDDARRIAADATGAAPWQIQIQSQQEIDRQAAFRACPILADYLATALQDLQLSEAERDEFDSGTIYDCSDDVFQWAQSYCERFMTECAADIESALNAHPGDDGFEYVRNPARLTYEGIGGTLYLASVGHGVGFTDDGRAPCLERLDQWARDNQRESLYFGDDGKVYA